MAGVEPKLAGLAGGLITMSQQVGGALGLALLASAAAWWTDRAITHGVGVPAALTDGFRLGFLVAAGILLAGTVVAVRTLRPGRAT